MKTQTLLAYLIWFAALSQFIIVQAPSYAAAKRSVR